MAETSQATMAMVLCILTPHCKGQLFINDQAAGHLGASLITWDVQEE